MQDLTAKRTLVKSPPELWSELSEVERLARHLDAFGEIRITKLEPEHTVAWEGEGASGTVSIEPSGWGTKVTLTAQVETAAAPASAGEAPETAAAEEEPEAKQPEAEQPEAEQPEAEQPEAEQPEAEAPQQPEGEQPEADPPKAEAPEQPDAEQPEAEQPVDAGPPRRGFFARLFRRRTPVPAEPIAGEAEPGPVAEADPATEPEPDPVAEPEPDPVAEPDPGPVAEQPSEPAPEPAPNGPDFQVILDEVLDALGSAHHRPFSRG